MKVGVLVRKKSRNVDGVVQAANIANRLQSDFEFDVEQVDWLQKGNRELGPKDVARRVKEKHVGKHLIVIISPPLNEEIAFRPNNWYLLAKYPEVEKKLWSELRAVLNGRSPCVQDLPRLPYTERVVKEAMRLYPPAWAIVRNSLKDCDIGGYRVPTGATVMVSHCNPPYSVTNEIAESC